MAAMSLSVASCTNEDMQDIQNADGRTPIALVSSVNNSRSANAGLQEAQLAKDMNVGVFVNNGEAGLIENGNNNRLAADGAGALVGGNAMYYPIDGSAVSIYAYAPYSDGWALGENTFTVSADQSTDEGYLASDLLYGTPDNNSITSSANPVSIHFKHKLSKLKLNFDMGETEVNSARRNGQCREHVACNHSQSAGRNLGHRFGCGCKYQSGSVWSRCCRISSERRDCAADNSSQH